MKRARQAVKEHHKHKDITAWHIILLRKNAEKKMGTKCIRGRHILHFERRGWQGEWHISWGRRVLQAYYTGVLTMDCACYSIE